MYCPFLKAREGELIALGHLTINARSDLTPFFDIQKPPKGKSLSVHLQSIADQIPGQANHSDTRRESQAVPPPPRTPTRPKSAPAPGEKRK